MKNGPFAFAVCGAALIIAFLAAVNYFFSPAVLWFVYPAFGVLWWPLGISLARRANALVLAVAASLSTIAFLAMVNAITSPGTLWFVYAAPALLCWPLGVWLHRRTPSLTVAVGLSLLLAASYGAMNLLLSPGYPWCVYPSFFLMGWPLWMYFEARGRQKEFSSIGAVAAILFLITVNLIHGGHPWALYACWPCLWWPLAMYAGKPLGGLRFSVICTALTALWYGALNLLLAPGLPWIIFIVFPMLWWPMTMLFVHSKRWSWYPAAGAALLIAFFWVTNRVTSPGYPWSAFPSLALLWWPLAMYFARHRSSLGFSVAGSLLVIGTLVAVNLLTSPGFLWSVFPSAAVLWWPVSVFFAGRRQPFAFAVCGVLLIALLLGSINLMTSPGFPWFLFPVFGALWWPAGVFFFRLRRGDAEGKGI